MIINIDWGVYFMIFVGGNCNGLDQYVLFDVLYMIGFRDIILFIYLDHILHLWFNKTFQIIWNLVRTHSFEEPHKQTRTIFSRQVCVSKTSKPMTIKLKPDNKSEHLRWQSWASDTWPTWPLPMSHLCLQQKHFENYMLC